MESIGYILVYMLKGELPWQGTKAQTKHEKYALIMEKKMSITPQVLCAGMPSEFRSYMQSVQELQFEEQPSYDNYRNSFRALAKRLVKAY
jgi:hypothetical protein